jgi:hypothetical protein
MVPKQAHVILKRVHMIPGWADMESAPTEVYTKQTYFTFSLYIASKSCIIKAKLTTGGNTI